MDRAKVVRDYKAQVEAQAQAKGHRLSSWVLVQGSGPGDDHHLQCLGCGCMFSLRYIQNEQRAGGMTITMDIYAVGISDAGAAECPHGDKPAVQ
jgi:hypothetical protein